MAPIKSPKASSAAECKTLEQLPNVGPAMAGDLRGLGIHQPAQLLGRDPLALYRSLERHTGKRQDPCVLDTFMAVVDFMHGAAPRPWWAYTAERKQTHGELHPAPYEQAVHIQNGLNGSRSGRWGALRNEVKEEPASEASRRGT